MATLRLLFCTNPHNPLSWMIRVGCWSKWSHVAIIDGADVVEAVALHGVSRRPLADRQAEDPRFQIVNFACTGPAAIVAAACSQIGKPYDYTAVLGLGLHRDWQEADSWFCSELVAWAFQQAGQPLFRPKDVGRVTPQHLWMLNPALNVGAMTAAGV